MPASSQLPSLEITDTSQERDTSASLRGNYHSRVPDISQQPLNTLLPMVKDGDIGHPDPYYITQNVVLKVPEGRPPWADGNRSSSSKVTLVSELWSSEEKFREQVVSELIKDCIHQEVAGIVSGTLAEQRAKNDKEAFLHAWLEDQVVTDTVYAATEDIVWEALWDQARKLKKRQMDELERQKKKHVDSHMLSVLRESYMHPLNSQSGGSIINKKWAELLYHTNRYMQRGSLMENYAIRKLQEQIISQIAAKVLLDQALKCTEEEMTRVDQDQRIDRPPQKVKASSSADKQQQQEEDGQSAD